MSASLTEKTNLPWYKQGWPWFLIALPATAVVNARATPTWRQRGKTQSCRNRRSVPRARSSNLRATSGASISFGPFAKSGIA